MKITTEQRKVLVKHFGAAAIDACMKRKGGLEPTKTGAVVLWRYANRVRGEME